MKKGIFLLLFGCMTLVERAEMSPEGFERFPNFYFVETGTWLGDGVIFALRAKFSDIHSIEINHSFSSRAERVFGMYKNVRIWEGNSGLMLWDVIKTMDKPITFWLDGHKGPDPKDPNTKNTPLMEELEQIKRHPIKNHTILIDDIRCCDTNYFDFLSKRQIENKILEINPRYYIRYINGGKAGERKNDILVAQVL